MIFENLSFLVDENSFKSKVQLELLKNSIQRNGGKLVKDCQSEGVITVTNGSAEMKFIQDSIANKTLMKIHDYVGNAGALKDTSERKRKEPSPNTSASKRLQAKLKGGKAQDISENPNKEILKEFQDLYDWYASEPSEKIRKDTYARIITSLKQYPHKITSADQVKKLPGIGSKTIIKVQDILDKKPNRKSTQIPDYVKTCLLFQTIYGVGASLAREWSGDNLY
jgi:Helix-hairpin-helix domain/BRCT domain, a BRCA1 C-terminus domain